MKSLTEKENIEKELLNEADISASASIGDKISHIRIHGSIDKAYAKRIAEELAAQIRKIELLDPFNVIDITIGV